MCSCYHKIVVRLSLNQLAKDTDGEIIALPAKMRCYAFSGTDCRPKVTFPRFHMQIFELCSNEMLAFNQGSHGTRSQPLVQSFFVWGNTACILMVPRPPWLKTNDIIVSDSKNKFNNGKLSTFKLILILKQTTLVGRPYVSPQWSAIHFALYLLFLSVQRRQHPHHWFHQTLQWLAR